MNILKFEKKKKYDQQYFELHLGTNYYNEHIVNRWDKARFVKDADSESYEILNHIWSKDKNFLYQRGLKLGLPDTDSFTVLNECFAKEKQTVYTIAGIFKDVKDPSSFTVCDDGIHPETAPAKTQESTSLIIDDDWIEDEDIHLSHGGYAKDNVNAYFFSEIISEFDELHDGKSGEGKPQIFERFTVIKNIDPESFKSLTLGFARDKHKVFYLGQELTDCDSDSFEIIPLSPLEYSDLILLPFSRDKNNIYLGYQKLPNADPESFNTIDSDLRWFKDKASIYYNQIKLHKADPQSFRLLDMNYGIDKSRAYFEHNLIAGADIGSFEQIGDHYCAQDKNYVYFEDKQGFKLTQGKLLELPNFEGIAEYFKDRKNIYYSNFGELQKIDVDYDSFELIAHDYGGPEARDINNLYLYGEVYDESEDDVVFSNIEHNEQQELSVESLQDEMNFLSLLSYDKEIIETYTHYLSLEQKVENRIQQYSIDDYEKLGEILSGDDELEKYRVKKEIQEFKNYTEQVDNFLENEIDMLVSDDNDFIDQLTLHEFSETVELDKQTPEEAKALRTIWWSDNTHSKNLRKKLLAIVEILTHNNIKIVEDTTTLLFAPEEFYEQYKHEFDYIDIVTYADICSRVKHGEVIDPVSAIIYFMLLPGLALYSLSEAVFPSELKAIFSTLCSDRKISIDLSMLTDESLTEHAYHDSAGYFIDQLAEQFELIDYKLFCLKGRDIESTELIGILPAQDYQNLIKHNTAELHFDDYFTEYPLRKGITALQQTLTDANLYNHDLLKKLDEYDRNQ